MAKKQANVFAALDDDGRYTKALCSKCNLSSNCDCQQTEHDCNCCGMEEVLRQNAERRQDRFGVDPTEVTQGVE